MLQSLPEIRLLLLILERLNTLAINNFIKMWYYLEQLTELNLAYFADIR